MKNIPLTPPEPEAPELIGESRLFLIFLFPAMMYVAGLIQRDDTLRLLALIGWPVIFVCSMLWGVWRMTDRLPADDTWRGIATYVFGSAAWFLLPLLFGVVTSMNWFLNLAFPLVFLPGCWALVAARRKYLPPLSPAQRAAILWAAFGVCTVWVLLFGALIFGHLRRPDLWPTSAAWIAAPLGFLALVLAVGLARSARKGYVRGRPLTTESLLAEPPVAS